MSEEDAWINLCLGSNGETRIQPTLSTLFCFSQSTIEQVLEYLVRFVETGRRIEYKVGQWIYTLLVILEQPLHPDTCSCLRSLARACSVIRADAVISFSGQTSSKSLDTLEINLNHFLKKILLKRNDFHL